MRFTDRSIAALRRKASRYEVWEDGRTGFGVRVAPSGRRSWVYMYRFAGKARRMTLGTYPKMSLADARVEFAEAKRKLDCGVDPGRVAVEVRLAERRAETVEDLIHEYLEKWARPRKRSAAEDERCLVKDVAPYWGSRKAKSITRRDVIVRIDSVADRAPVMANRLLAVVRRMFGFAVDREIVDVNPCSGVKAPAKETQRDRILTDPEIAAFWNNLDKAGMSDQVRLALKYQLITAQRKSEVVEAEWSEFDLDNAVWTIAAARSKNGVAHAVPLSPMALNLLEQIKVVSDGSRWLFPSPKRMDGPIGTRAVNHALGSNRDTIRVENLTPHDLRRTAASQMTALGIPRLVVGKVLNHADRDITAVYDRHGYYAEKIRALDAWSRRLEEIISGRRTDEAGKVVKLPRTGQV